jgi:hypothetical protein
MRSQHTIDEVDDVGGGRECYKSEYRDRRERGARRGAEPRGYQRMADRNNRLATCALMLVIGSLGGGCTLVAPITGSDRETVVSERLPVLDVLYARVMGVDGPREHRLDLHRPDPGSVPDGALWPVVVFVRGSESTDDARSEEADPADPYQSLGRFLASQGIGAALLRPRPESGTNSRAQVKDLGRAIRWIEDHVERWGGDPASIFVSGDAAGARLAARFGLGPVARLDAGVDPCGLILVSGTGYENRDEQGEASGANRTYFEERFVEESGDWESDASAVQLVQADSPPALIVYGAGEPEPIQRQSILLANAYGRARARAWKAIVPGGTDGPLVLTLSLEGQTAGPAMLGFIRAQTCAEPLLF